MKKEDWIKIEGPESWPGVGVDVLVRFAEDEIYDVCRIRLDVHKNIYIWDDYERGAYPITLYSHWQPIVGPE